MVILSRCCKNVVIEDGYHGEEVMIIEEHHPEHTVVVEHSF